MIRVIHSHNRYRSEADWLTSYWHFSFDHYYDPENIRWGALRVFNEDWIKPSSGFPFHPHSNMEIITYVISGELTHEDSLGNKEKIRAGEIQRMTAGPGIVHAEYNESTDEEVHLLQMWVVPSRRGLTPNYEQRRFTREQRQGRLLPVASDNPQEGALLLHQDATFYISALESGQQLVHDMNPEHHGYLFVIDGEVTLNGQTLYKGDQARIHLEEQLVIKAAAPTELVLWDTI